MDLCVCEYACTRACTSMRASEHAYVCVRVRVHALMHACACLWAHEQKEGRFGRMFLLSLQRPGLRRQETKHRNQLKVKLLCLALATWPLSCNSLNASLQNLRASRTLSRNSHPSKPTPSGSSCRRDSRGRGDHLPHTVPLLAGPGRALHWLLWQLGLYPATLLLFKEELWQPCQLARGPVVAS